MSERVRRALVLLSGGMDSIAACRWVMAQKGWELPACLTVDYGQPAATEEVLAASRWCRAEMCDHVVCGIEADAGELALGGKRSPRVVAGRNAMLLALGVNVAANVGADVIVLGATASDHDDYPDCTPEFVAAASRLFGSAYRVRVAAPLQSMKKAEAARLLTDADLELAFSCYTPAGRGRHCERCRSCIERTAVIAARV